MLRRISMVKLAEYDRYNGTVILLGVAVHTLNINSFPSGVSFTLDGSRFSTPQSQSLSEGIHTIVMPTTIDVEGITYYFQKWEDGSTNPKKTINLTSDTTLTATYSTTPPSPPPPPEVPWIAIIIFAVGTALIVSFK